MAENVQITPGVGVTIGADNVLDGTLGNAQIQYVKIMDGAIGGTNKATVTTNGLVVDGSATTQPISAVSLPLPTGAATETTLTSVETNTDNLDVLLSTRATEATLSDIKDQTDELTFVASRLLVDGSGVTQPVSALSLPLPTGAATETTLVDIETNTNNLDVALSTRASELTLSSIKDQTDELTFISNRLLVDGSGVIQPISGTVAATQSGTWSTGRTWVLASVTDAVDSVQSGIWSTRAQDGSGTPLTSTLVSGKQALDVNIAGGVTLTVDLNEATDSVQIYGNDGTTNQAIKTNVAGEIQVDVVNSVLPTGAATSALQTSGNASLASIDGKTPALGQALAAASVPVVLTTAQLATLTPLSTVAVTQSTSPWVVSGSVTANAGTGTFTVGQATGTNLHTVVDSGSITVANATIAVTQSGTWTTGRTWTLASGSDSVASVQSGAWSIAVNNAAGAAAVNIQDGGNSITVDGTVSISGSVAVTGPLTDTQLRATPVPVSVTSTTITGTVAVTQSTSPWVVSGTVTSNAGTGTFNNQQSNITLDYDTGAGTQNLTVWGIALPASGGAVAGGTATNPIRIDPTGTTAQPVSGTVAATQSGTWNITNISGTVSLPTGAATETTLSTRLADATFTARINTLGQKTMANSTPVVLASDQSAIPASQSGTWNITNITGTISLPTGAATSANQTTANTSLSTIAGAILGQGSTTAGQNGNLMLGAVTTASPAYTTAQSSPLSLNTAGSLRTDNTSWLGSTAPTVGQKTSANSLPVVISSDQTAIPVSLPTSTTGTTSNVSRSNANQTFLASNTARKGATIYNDSGANVYVKLAATASTTSFSVQIASQAYYEVPFNYTGIIDGIWGSNGAGAARITELT